MSFDDWLAPGALLEHGARHHWPNSPPSILEVVEVCALDLATGQVAVVDPAYSHSFDETGPVFAQVPPGRYPLLLSVLVWPETDRPGARSRVVTAATLKISNNPVVRWSWVGERPDGTVVGVGVDAGTICLFDAAELERLAPLSADEDRVDTLLSTALEAGFAPIADDAGRTVAVFVACGMGDGFYPVRIGRNASDAIAMIMVDLELLNHSE